MISLVLPFHGDVKRLFNTMEKINKEASQYKIQEVLLCHNGTNLEALEEAKKFESTFVRLIHASNQGIGVGYCLGIENAKSQHVLLSASDLPFDFSDIKEFLKCDPLPLIAIGSKLHPQSKVSHYTLKRQLASYAYYGLRRILIGKNTPRDTQGTIFIKTDLAKFLISKIKSRDYFFSTELVLKAQTMGYPIVELPVEWCQTSKESSVSIFKDGFSMTAKLIREVLSKSNRN